MLGLDVSTSVDAAEYALQRDGVVAALGDPGVQAALFSGAGHVALAVFEWSGSANQALVLDWTRLRNPSDLDRARARIGRAQRSATERTALGAALVYAAQLFSRAPPDCAARTLDISGDGRSNEGPEPADIYAALPAYDGILVNGLAVGGELEGVDSYYRDVLIHGPGAFIEIANNYTDFARIMARKLEREIGSLVMATDSAGKDSAPAR